MSQRDRVLAFLKTQSLGSYKLSQEVPFTNSGQTLYTKNVKWIYVDSDQVEVDHFLRVLGGVNVDQEIRTVRVFFSNDSKNLPTDYDQVLTVIQSAKELAREPEQFERQAQVSTEFEGDLLITTVELRYSKLIQ